MVSEWYPQQLYQAVSGLMHCEAWYSEICEYLRLGENAIILLLHSQVIFGPICYFNAWATDVSTLDISCPSSSTKTALQVSLFALCNQKR